jgi:MoxR-like ATPase
VTDAERIEGPETTGRTDPAALFTAVVDAVRHVLLADDTTVRLAVGCLATGGHLLVEDYPGLGKTTLAKALAHASGLDFTRVQFTADLLPADITGAVVFDQARNEPVFRPGPIFANVVLADELNRASPRAQSALLEAMEEGQVSADGASYALPRPFIVIATQNPYDAAGTSPLPHGQRDRFLMRLSLGYPTRDQEDALLAGDDPSVRAARLPAAVSADQLAQLLAAVDAVHVAPAARAYLLDLVAATRAHPSVQVGASPRAALALVRASKAMAVAAGRTYVSPEDVQVCAGPTLAHRLLLRPGSEAAAGGADEVVAEVVEMVAVPLEGPRGGAPR